MLQWYCVRQKLLRGKHAAAVLCSPEIDELSFASCIIFWGFELTLFNRCKYK